MKKILILIILVTTIDNIALDKKKAISFCFDLASIYFDAAGDAHNNSGKKEIGHLYNASNIALLVSQPFIIDYEKKDFLWKIPSYILLRFAAFNIIYNKTHPLIDDPLYYGKSDYIDKFCSKKIYGNKQIVPKFISFSIALYINTKK